uniref:Src homology 2 domain containing transforming protein D n=1 Tax=Dromaius novaehollandiae TaxID=8790 RepID=A0A8C4JHS3_DRONO
MGTTLAISQSQHPPARPAPWWGHLGSSCSGAESRWPSRWVPLSPRGGVPGCPRQRVTAPSPPPAVQFESPDRSPSRPREPPRTPRAPAGARPGCPPSPGRVDPSLPLEKQAWYHGPIGRAGAETLLALCREGSFLVRDCETSPDDYSLSLRSSQGFVHVKLTRTRERHFVLGRAGAAFPSVPEAVRHYTARALPVRGARHLSLLYPVAAQPL